MSYKKRKIAYEQLKDVTHLEADMALLKKLKPEHYLLSKKMKPERLQAEILYELLGFDNVTREMVVKNRREMQGPSEKEIVARCIKLVDKLEKATNK